MKIGVKYCGGCNPRYERKKFIDKVKEAVGEKHTFEAVKEENVYDFLLVAGGCTSCCADFRNISVKYGVFCIKREEDYENVLDVITRMDQWEKGW